MRARTKRTLVLLLLLLTLTLAACQTSQPPEPTPVAPPVVTDPPPAPQPEPTVGKAQEGCLDPGVDSSTPHASLWLPGRDVIVMSGLCPLQIGENAELISIFPPSQLDAEEMLAGLRVSPQAALNRVKAVPPTGKVVQLQVTLHPGKPGDRVEVSWEGQGQSFGFALERLANPRVVGEYRLGQGEWHPWTEVLTIPQQPASFRFRPTGGLTLDQVVERIRRDLGKTPATVTTISADTVEVTVPALPSLLAFDFWNLEAKHARPGPNGFTLYTGEAPRAVWLDPATGQETVIGEVPADIFQAMLSPDGAYAMLLAYAPESSAVTRAYVMETATGRLRQTNFTDNWAGNELYWQPDRVIFPAIGRMQIWHLSEQREEIIPSEVRHWGPISPDGRYIPGFRVDGDRENPQTMLAPATIYLFDLQSGTERAIPELIDVRVPHSSRPYYVPMIWEGGLLLLGDSQGLPPGGGQETWKPVTLDPVTGKLTPGQGDLPPSAVWPKWLPGPGGWEAAPHGWWGDIKVRQAGGAERSFGQGYAAGWEPGGRLLLIRWNPERRRFRATE